MLEVPHVFFSPSSKGSFSFANVVPGARCARNFIDDIALVVLVRSKLGDRKIYSLANFSVIFKFLSLLFFTRFYPLKTAVQSVESS